MDGKFDWLIAKAAAQPGPTLRVAVIHPVDASSLKGALDAAQAGIMTPILVGPIAKMSAAAELAGLDISGLVQIEAPYSHAAAARSVELIHEGNADALMKGALHTNEMMAEIVKRAGGLRTDRRMSHVFLLSTAGYHKPLLISDGALNIAPDLTSKRWITQNAIDAARAIDIDPPSCLQPKRWTRSYRPHWMQPPCARWRTEVRSRAASWTAPLHLIWLSHLNRSQPKA